MLLKSIALIVGLAGALFGQAPVLVGTNPDTVVVGSQPQGFPILIYGSNFQPGATIRWNNTVIGNQFNGPLSMVGIVPPSLITTAGTAQITVRNPDGKVSSAVTFTIRTTPATPNFVGATTDVTANLGQPQIRQLTIVGSGVQPGVVLNWNGLVFPAEAGYPFLAFGIPLELMLAPGPANLFLTNPGGLPSNILTLTIPAPRTLTSVSPATISPGGGDVTLTVNGSGFEPGDFIALFTGIVTATLLPTQFVSNTQLRVVAPSSPAPLAVLVAYSGPEAGAGVPILAPDDFPSAIYVTPNMLTLSVGPPGCTYSLSSSGATVGTAASTGSIQVITQPGCAWTATSGDTNAVTVTAGATGSGTATYSVKASANTRSRTLTIAGLSFTINQISSCVFGLTPSSANVPAGGATSSLALGVTQSTCSWSAASSASWLQVTSSSSGTGPATINYSALPNASNVGRVATITAGGETFTVIQAGNAPCVYSLVQASQSFASAGGSGAATVQTPAGCSWTAASNAPWITVGVAPATSGNGNVTYSAAANPGAATRTGSLTIAGLTYTVIQAGTSSNVTCTANSPAPPQIALEGRSETVGDLQLTCTGLTGPVTADISLGLNANVTNADSTLLVNEANPRGGQLLSYATIRWPGVTLVADSTGTATVRISNVHVDASLLTAPANLQATPVTGVVTVESQTPVPVSNAQQTLASAAPTLAFQTQIFDAGSLTRVTVTFSEATATAFKPSTRLRLVLNNIPAGVAVYAPVFSNEGTTQAQLYSADANGAGGSPVVGSPFNGGTYQQLTVTNGTATATWVMGSASPVQLETRTFLIYLGAGAATTGGVSYSGSLAPLPTYRDFSAPLKFVNLRVSTTVNTTPRPLAPTSGSNVTFSTQVINDDGTQTATNVIVRNNVSTGGTIVSCASSTGQPCNTSGSLATVTYASLAPGASATVTVVIAPSASLPDGSVIENDVGVSSDDPNATLAGTTASTSTIVLNGQPVVVGTSPAAGSGSSNTFTFQFSHPLGYQNLGVVNVLINRFLDGRNACYLAYSVPTATLYLVNDTGDAGGPYAGTMPLGGAGAIQNSQCSASLVSAQGDGNMLTLKLGITFKSAFGGNRITYVAARDQGTANSDWQAVGVWQAPFTAGTIAATDLTPARASGSAGASQQLKITLTDTNGAGDLGIVNVLINNFIDGRSACYLAYLAAANTLYLVNDAGDGGGPFAGSMLLNGGNGAIQNSQCSVAGTGSSATPASNQVTLTLNITFTSAFTGNRVVYVAGRDKSDGNNTDWQALGTFTVQ